MHQQQRIRRPGEINQDRPGNAYLKGALGICALSIARSNNTHLAAKYRRIASRRGPSRAIVAIERTLLVTIWTMAHTGAHYQDPGPDYYLRLNPERAKRKALAQLASLGYNVTYRRRLSTGGLGIFVSGAWRRGKWTATRA